MKTLCLGISGRGIRRCCVGASLVLLAGGGACLADDRAELVQVVAEMSRAVLAGDRAGYLAHVDTRDPVFLAEQEHWADDLSRHVPLEFDLGMMGDPVVNADAATVPLRMRYRMGAGHAATETGKTATWPARFAKVDTDGEGPAPARWLYAGEEWQELWGRFDLPGEAPAGPGEGRFVVRFLAGAEKAAQDIVSVFPDAKRHVDEGMEVTIRGEVQIKLYSSMEHLKAWVYLSMPDEVLGGWNEPGESIKFMSNYTNGPERWLGAFAHEYGHYATWTYGPRIKSAPWWMVEGVAELGAERFVKDRDRIDTMMRRLHAQGKLCEWDEIADYDKAAQPVKRMAYFQGHHLMGYVSERWGRKGRNDWIRAVANGATLDEATTRVLGLTFAALDAQWRTSLASEGDAPHAPR